MIAPTRGMRRIHLVRTLALAAFTLTLALSSTARCDDAAVLLPAKPSDQLDNINASAQGLAGKSGLGRVDLDKGMAGV